MKHIDWCLERIQIEMASMPRSVKLSAEQEKAREVLLQVKRYADTLAQIIENPKFKKYLRRLEASSLEGIRLQAHEIEELLKDLEHMLYVLNKYLENLEDIINNHPEQWPVKVGQLALMIHQKFGGERTALRKEFKVAVHTADELREVVKSEEHLEQLLK